MRTNKHLVSAIAGIVSVLIVAGAIWPLSEQRNSAIDDTIENDLTAIASLVDEYFDEESRIPDELADLDLSKDIKNRAESYSYELDKKTRTDYELCAEFKTDTTNESASTIYPLDISIQSTSPYYGFSQAARHSAGLDCIEYQVYGNFRNSIETDFSSPFEGGLFDSFEENVDAVEVESQVFEL